MQSYIFYIVSVYYLYFMDMVGKKFKLKSIKIKRKEGKVILSRSHNSNSSIFFVLLIAVTFILVAFRYNVGWDYSAYYETIEFNRYTNIVGNGEKLTILLINLSKNIRVTNLYFFSNALILFFGIIYYIVDFSSDKGLSLITFITFPLFLLNSLSVIRIFTAIGISLIAFRYLFEQNRILFVVLIIVASQFHMSALICLAFLFIFYLDFGKLRAKIYFVLIPFLNMIMRFITLNYFPRYSIYLNSSPIQAGTKSIYILLVIAFISMFYYPKEDGKVKERGYFNLFYFGVILYMAFFDYGTLGHRLSLFGTIHVIMVIPYIYQQTNIKYKKLLLILFHAVQIVSFLYTIHVGAETYIPYQTIWSK